VPPPAPGSCAAGGTSSRAPLVSCFTSCGMGMHQGGRCDMREVWRARGEGGEDSKHTPAAAAGRNPVAPDKERLLESRHSRWRCQAGGGCPLPRGAADRPTCQPVTSALAQGSCHVSSSHMTCGMERYNNGTSHPNRGDRCQGWRGHRMAAEPWAMADGCRHPASSVSRAVAPQLRCSTSHSRPRQAVGWLPPCSLPPAPPASPPPPQPCTHHCKRKDVAALAGTAAPQHLWRQPALHLEGGRVRGRGPGWRGRGLEQGREHEGEDSPRGRQLVPSSGLAPPGLNRSEQPAHVAVDAVRFSKRGRDAAAHTSHTHTHTGRHSFRPHRVHGCHGGGARAVLDDAGQVEVGYLRYKCTNVQHQRSILSGGAGRHSATRACEAGVTGRGPAQARNAT
jgi:hypothetical protein